MWTTVPTVVFVVSAITVLAACIASIVLVGRQAKGWTKVEVKLLGLGFTVERDVDGKSKEVKPHTDTPTKRRWWQWWRRKSNG